MISIDFHTHTFISKDSLTAPEKLIETARRRKLDRVVVTDHNSLRGAMLAHTLAPELIIMGEEIKTSKGEILAAFVKEEIPAKLPPHETIQRLRDQGAFISVSHPFDNRSGAWELKDLLEIAERVDAIEIFNARIMKPDANSLAEAFAREHKLGGTVGSDAHAPFELGVCRLEVPEFEGAEGLKAVIGQGRVVGRTSPWWVHFASFYARWKKNAV